MNILFGKEQATALADKYIVLELDTIQIGKDGPVVTAYCAVEIVPPGEMEELLEMQELHQQLLSNYKLRRWADCQRGIEILLSRWNGELDSFYSELQSRINEFQQLEPADRWNGIIVKD
jgi:hypothetical protein